MNDFLKYINIEIGKKKNNLEGGVMHAFTEHPKPEKRNQPTSTRCRLLLAFTNNSYHKPTWFINNPTHYAGLTRIFRITSLQHCARKEKKEAGAHPAVLYSCDKFYLHPRTFSAGCHPRMTMGARVKHLPCATGGKYSSPHEQHQHPEEKVSAGER